jgi:hypothetical protein
MNGRDLRPGPQETVRDPSKPDETSGREIMEASEHTSPSRRRGGSPALHRIDLDRVAGTLSSSRNADGYARLNLMVSTIFDRLVSDSGEARR